MIMIIIIIIIIILTHGANLLCIVFILYKQFNFISLGIYKKHFACEKSTEV